MRRPAFLAVLTAVLAVFALVVVLAQPAAAPASSAVAPSGGRGANEAIAVHGHWTIDVTSADGTAVTRTEFENALAGNGAFYLSYVLSREGGMGTWGIFLHGSPQICSSGGSPVDCMVAEASPGAIGSWPNTSQFGTLTVNRDVNKVVLRGTLNAQADGSITQVSSVLCFSLPRNFDLAACNNADKFTTANLTTPVAVANGQQVQVSVTLSFQ